MKELKEFEEELYKCSRCALCQSVCPVYKASLSECAVTKGKFNMLNGVIKGDLSVTKQMKKYLDMCTGCNACKDFCPSSIDAGAIIRCAKEEYYKTNKLLFMEKVFNSYSVLKLALIFSKPCFFMYRFLHVGLFVKLFEKVLINSGEIGRKILLLNFFAVACNRVKKTPKIKSKAEKKAVFFDGCVNKYVNPITEKAVFKLLNLAGYKIIKRNFECCGVTFFNDGNIKQFKIIIDKNLKQLNTDFDCVVTDCASCYEVLRSYKNYSDNNVAEMLSEKVVSVSELIKNLRFISEKSLKVAVHVPCHEQSNLIEFVKNIQNVEYVEAKDYDKCCGFSGTFALKNAELSNKISYNKAQNYINANADIVLTTCPSCMLGLEQGFISTKIPFGKRPKVMNLFVFLSEFCSVL